MILRNATIKYKGYDPLTLSKGSHKRVCISCDECGRVRWVEFKTKKFNICQSCAHIGIKPSKETLLKKSESAKGRKHSNETKAKISKNHARLTGENNSLWNPNITNEERLIKRKYPEYKQWRNEIFERDNFVCQKCDQIGYKLNAHHLESYSNNKKLRITLLNGITLCEDCHKDFHHIYGNNCTKIQFIEFMENYNYDKNL